MKNEKGDAAFDSADEVLTDRIISTTEKHGETNDPSSLDSTSNYSFDGENPELATSGKNSGKAIFIAACIGIMLLIAGIFMFRCRKCCRGK